LRQEVRLFLDSSVVLAACGRATGASHAIFDLATEQDWQLLTCDYVLVEVERNLLKRMPEKARHEWQALRFCINVVADELTHPWPVVFTAAKDRPVLFTAAAAADVLLTLDQGDFGALMQTGFYGLSVIKPGDFLIQQRSLGRL
jgi:predicted nucleic acid-binding protein